MSAGYRPEETNRVRLSFTCPRCKARLEGGLEEGSIEVEEPYFLEAVLPPRLSVLQLKAVRAVYPPTSLATLRKTLESLTTLRLGPYSMRRNAQEAQAILEAAGLETKLHYGE